MTFIFVICMENLNTITQKEFVDHCTKMIQGGRMLSLSGLFSPIFNTDGYLTLVSIPNMPNIATLIDEENKTKAVKAFTDICVAWYGLSGKMHRPNCVDAIQKLSKNPLIKTAEEGESIKSTIIEALFQKYSGYYEAQLKQDFPQYTQKFQHTVSGYEKGIAASLSHNGSEGLKNKPIPYLQSILKGKEKIPDNYTEKDVVLALLCQYLTQEKTGVNRMNTDTYQVDEDNAPMDRSSIIARYGITIDALVQQIKQFDIAKKIRNPTKVRILVKSYTAEQWAGSQDALNLMHDMYTNALKFGKFVICRNILAHIDLTKYFNDVKDSTGIISNSMLDSSGVVTQLKTSIKAGKIEDALNYAKTLGQVYVETAFKLAAGSVENNVSGLRMLDYLIARKDMIQDTGSVLKTILERKAVIRLTFGKETYHPEEAQKIMETYPISQDTLDKIIESRFNSLLPESIDPNYEEAYLSYLDQFPLAKNKINEHKLRILSLIYKKDLNWDVYLSEAPDNITLLDTLKTKFKEVHSVELPKDLNEEQSYIAGEILREIPGAQKKKLKSIFNHMLQDHEEVKMLKLIQKAGAKHEVDYAHRLPLLMQSVANYYESSYEDIETTIVSIANILEKVEKKEDIYTACIEKIFPKIIQDISKDDKKDDHEGEKEEDNEAKKMISFILPQINNTIPEKDRERIKKQYIDSIGATAMQQGVLKVMEYILDNFMALIDDKTGRVSELFTKSIAAQDYDLSEKLLSIYGKYVSSDITLQQIKVKKVQKSMENEKNKGLLEEDFKSLLQLIKNVGDDEKVIEELIKLLSEYTITTQEGYDFLKHIYAIDVNKQIREIIEKKLIDCTMQEVDRTGKARKIEVDLEMCYNILKKLCHEQNINEDCAKSFCKTIDRLYRQYYRKYRGYESTSEDYHQAYMFSKQIYDGEAEWKENAIDIDREDRQKKRQKAKVSYIASELEIIESSLQLLRGVKDLHVDDKKTKKGAALEKCIIDLHTFSIEHAASKIYQERILGMLKEYYALTGQTEKLNALIAQRASEDQKMLALKKDLINFLHDKGNASLQQLEDLIALFGIDSAADILFSQHPQYKALGAMEVKSLIAEHLGDVLLQHRGLSFVDIPTGLDITPKKFQDNMLTVVEKDFLKYYRETKKQGPSTNAEICTSYIESLKDKFKAVTSHKEILDAVIEKFSVFLDQILDMQIPDRLVKSLDTDREFPDFLQRLNAIEILNKKRFLIADGMGMGKSLSAILAKEVAQFKKCLLIVPSNTMDTRLDYLSDKVDAEGKQIGYFAKGQAPNVLVINSLEDLNKLSADDTYDYVVISQERLASEKSIDKLLEQKFDYVVVDEVHKLKNLSSGKRASGLLDIVEKIEHIDGNLCLLSGTPIPNTIIDIAMLIKLLYPEEYGSWDNQELVSSIINGDVVSLRSLLLPRMQMKELTENINMPDLYEETKYVDFSEKERFYYDSIRNDENITLLEKLMLLRKLAISPKLLGIEDIEQSSKAITVGTDANELFKTKRKVVYFFNSFINGVLRPTENIEDTQTFISQMHLDPDIQIRIIDGTTEKVDRKKIQDEFAQSDEKIALFVSGQTADVGIDLTPGEEVVFVVDPRTKSDKGQQLARVYRYRQKKDIKASTYIVRNSIEKIISDYIILKDKAIMKLYHGLKLSELEKLVLQDDDIAPNTKPNHKEVNKGLIRYFKKSSEELRDFYADTKGVGSEKMEEIIAKDGENIAGYYKGLGPRSYQANVNRWHATIISSLLARDHLTQTSIVDLGSGPKMLYQHISEELKDNVISMDLNKHNFSEQDIATGKAIVGNFVDLPFADDSIDIVSCSLAFNDTSRNVNTADYERLQVLCQLQRVLKIGGSTIISLPYSVTYKDKKIFVRIVEELGFEIEDEYSGDVIGEGFKTETITLRKTDNTRKTLQDMVAFCKSKDLASGLLFAKNPEKIVSSKDVITSISLDENIIPIELNQATQKIVQTEQNYKNLVNEWLSKYDDMVKIPSDILRSYGFGRYYNKKSCVLLTQLPNGAGLFSHRQTRRVNTEKNT